MALPTGPIPGVAFDEIIEVSWGDSVAQSLNNLNQGFDYGIWKPPSAINAPTSATMATWFTVGGATPIDLFVPDWATHAYVHLEMNGVRDLGPSNNTYLLQMQLGTVDGRTIKQSGYAPQGWYQASWSDRIPSSTIPGNRNLKVMAARVSGTSNWVIDNDSDIAVSIGFHAGAIG